MQKILITVAALATFAAIPATVHAAPLARPVAVQGDVDARIDAALEAAKKKVLAGDLDRAAYTELVAAIRAGYSALQTATPNAETIRTRLVAAIDDIYARAKTAKIAADEFELLRIESINARLNAAIAAAMAEPNQDNVKRIITHLTALADAAKAQDPDIGNVRTRVQAMIDELTKKARIAATDLQPIALEISASQATRAEAILERHATDGVVTPTDFARAKNSIGDHLDVLAKTDPSVAELRKKLMAAIDALQTRAAGAKLTRADFNELRDQLIARARTAAAPK